MPRASSDREAFWRELLVRHAASNLSVEEICRKAGVSTASFYAWRRRLGDSCSSVERSALVPVRIVADDVARRNEGGAEPILIEVTPVSDALTLRITVPSACDEESIRRVIQAILHSGGAGR
jgi:hypothetical protein